MFRVNCSCDTDRNANVPPPHKKCRTPTSHGAKNYSKNSPSSTVRQAAEGSHSPDIKLSPTQELCLGALIAGEKPVFPPLSRLGHSIYRSLHNFYCAVDPKKVRCLRLLPPHPHLNRHKISGLVVCGFTSTCKIFLGAVEWQTYHRPAIHSCEPRPNDACRTGEPVLCTLRCCL